MSIPKCAHSPMRLRRMKADLLEKMALSLTRYKALIETLAEGKVIVLNSNLRLANALKDITGLQAEYEEITGWEDELREIERKAVANGT